jgi:hypothetical protein
MCDLPESPVRSHSVFFAAVASKISKLSVSKLSVSKLSVPG